MYYAHALFLIITAVIAQDVPVGPATTVNTIDPLTATLPTSTIPAIPATSTSLTVNAPATATTLPIAGVITTSSSKTATAATTTAGIAPLAVTSTLSTSTTPAPVTPPPQTTVWVTTTIGGVQTVVPSIYSQQFSAPFDGIPTMKSGRIGLGTQTAVMHAAQTATSGAQRGTVITDSSMVLVAITLITVITTGYL
ncbi:hypothetical protein FPQ18DRAFT_376181 [Pyronema domesticum]|nr:hypothetical protein FPQ18DRAFT_376181 [Pyronema domesticum]